jgi:hypothetical protein
MVCLVERDDQHQLWLSTDDIMTMRVGLTAYLREFARHRAEDGGATHPEAEWQALQREVGQLLSKMEEATASPSAHASHSEDAVRPESGVTDQGPTGRADTPVRGSDGSHSFSVWRLLPDGQWTGAWSEETRVTVEFRGHCSCGWEGPAIAGNPETGREDDLERERVYDFWDRHHVPDWAARHGL